MDSESKQPIFHGHGHGIDYGGVVRRYGFAKMQINSIYKEIFTEKSYS